MTTARDRSSLALERLVRRFEGRVRGIGQRFGLSPVDLDELFQEVRIRVWKALENPESIESVSGSYVHKTARSAALDLIRQKRVGGPRVPLDPNLPNGRDSNPHNLQEAREAAEDVSQALGRLDDRRRPVVRMYLAGYGYQEIARLLGWSPGATRNLLYRGLAEVRADLTEREKGVE